MAQVTAPVTRIAQAFALGWHMAELYHFDRLPGEGEPEHADSLPGIGRLDAAQRALLISRQVPSALEQLGQGALAQEDRGRVDAALAVTPIDVPTLQAAVLSVHTQLLTMLTVLDAPVGSSYGLGRALAETMLVPTTKDPTSFSRAFGQYRVRTLQEWLLNLEGQFPPYAAPAVRRTLDRWAGWVQTTQQAASRPSWTSEQKGRVGQCVRRQGEMWYGLLTGIVEPTRLLGPDEYAQAAQSLMSRIGRLAWHFLVSTGIGRVLGLLSIGLCALLAWVIISGHLGAVAGTTVVLLGALGVTTGSVVAAVGRVLRQAQAPLWAAELTEGIATAAAVLPD